MNADAAVDTYLDTQAARHQRQIDDAAEADTGWEKALKELYFCLLNNGAVFRGGRRWIDKNDVMYESLQEHLGNMLDQALESCHVDHCQAGLLLARAKSRAVKSLLEKYGDRMREAWDREELSWEAES